MNEFILPENIDFDKILKKSQSKRIKIDVLKFIVSSILWQVNYNKNGYWESDNEFVPLSATILKHISYDYKCHIELLITSGVIEPLRSSNEKISYQIGKACKRYRVALSIGRPKYEKIPQNILNKMPEIWKAPEFLNKWFNELLTIDRGAAELVIEKIGKKEGSWRMFDSVNRIISGNYNLIRDAKGRRVYSPLTNLKRELRPLLRYNGKKLVELDLKSSQPFLIATLFLNKLFYKV